MGLYDDIRCHAPLPGDPPAWAAEPGHAFQTKDLDCTMSLYDITADGRLVRRTAGVFGDNAGGDLDEDTHHHGTIEFYDGNSVASHSGVPFTRDGRPSEWVRYLASFNAGQLVKIVEAERTRQPALPVATLDAMRPTRPTDEEIARDEARRAESLVGRTMYAMWPGGTSEVGHAVEIVAESPHEWVGRKPDGRFEIFDRRFARGNRLFDSEEAARADRAGRIAEEAERKARFEGLFEKRE